MSAPRYDYAQRKAGALLKEAIDCGIYDPEKNLKVPVEEIAVQLRGIVVKEDQLGEKSGVIHKSADGRILCVVNVNHPRERKRFTKAHELGHNELHLISKGTIIDQKKYRTDESSYAVDADEIEANQFAAHLLMPKDYIIKEFLQLISETPNSNDENEIQQNDIVEKMAMAFEVSNKAMEYRLISLDLIS